MLVEIAFALLAGMLTVAAPCILPMLPILLGVSIGQSSRWRPLFIVIGFVITFAGASLVFSAVTHILGLSPDVLRNVAIVLLALFGLMMIWPAPYEWLMLRLGPRLSFGADGESSSPAGALLIGASLGLVWTPCAGPILASILVLIASSPDITRAGVLLLAYSIGSAVPMLIIAYSGQFASTRVRFLTQYTHHLQRVFGVCIILIAGAMYMGYDIWITTQLADFYPNAQMGL